jgi:hypothetical protein
VEYLVPEEFEAFGLPVTTSTAQVRAASALVDAHCRRPTLGTAQYLERLRFAPGSARVQLTYTPLENPDETSPVLAVRARYAFPRKGELVGASHVGEMQWADQQFGAEVAMAYQLPGQWVELASGSYEVMPQTGEMTVFPGILGLPYTEVEVTYVAGYVTIPEAVKQACAQIVRNAQAMPAMNVKRSKVEHMEIDYFAASLIDESVRALLAPYVAC